MIPISQNEALILKNDHSSLQGSKEARTKQLYVSGNSMKQ